MRQPQPWPERAMEQAEAISDAWEVCKAYAGRLAEWVLFGCMVANIVEVLAPVPPVVENVVLSVQAITLDIAGFGLATMAGQARRQGHERAASRARVTAWGLIGLMMVTLLCVSVGVLWPDCKPSTDAVEKVLMLGRVVMTVLYGHVVQSLREAKQEHTNEVTSLQEERARLQEERDRAQQQVQELTRACKQKQAAYEQVNGDLQTAQSTVADLQAAEKETAHLQEDYQALCADLQTAHLQIADLTAKLQTADGKRADLHPAESGTAKLRSAPSADKITSIDTARAKHEAGSKVKVSHAEVVAFMSAHPTLKRAEVAQRLGISERKVYDAVAWQKGQEHAAALH
ncbi:MAG: hypothetical protein JO202_07970 [Ktedonobacteraceae bacterium]|nr:hypothetical protein [Ktedonobacteraceae bacterium]